MAAMLDRAGATQAGPGFTTPPIADSGQRAGGPAYLLNPSYAWPGSYYGPGWYGRSPAYGGSGRALAGPLIFSIRIKADPSMPKLSVPAEATDVSRLPSGHDEQSRPLRGFRLKPSQFVQPCVLWLTTIFQRTSTLSLS
jgi:hypothetical protein